MAPDENSRQASTLTGIGVTLIGVVISVGVTVGFGLPGSWWARSFAGAGTAVGLVALIKLGTRQGPQGPLARFARWITSWDG